MSSSDPAIRAMENKEHLLENEAHHVKEKIHTEEREIAHDKEVLAKDTRELTDLELKLHQTEEGAKLMHAKIEEAEKHAEALEKIEKEHKTH